MNIQIILGSVREGRIADRLGTWVRERVAQRAGHHTELIDLREWHLPPNDEPGMPAAMGIMYSRTRWHGVARSRKGTLISFWFLNTIGDTPRR